MLFRKKILKARIKLKSKEINCMRKIIITIIILFLSFSINIANAQKRNIILGIERISEYKELFQGQRIGLITNPTGIDKNLKSSVEIFSECTNITAIFSPEHGFLGQISAGDNINNGYSLEYNLPIYTLYGNTKKPTPDMLKNIDVLVFDIQDIGTRHYTYVSTMAYAMQAAQENKKKFVVLDRPNPLSGIMQGPILKSGNESFIGLYPLPLRHGMTVGELALLFNKEYGINADLTVIPMLGWQRQLYFDETNLPWVMTSPNIPTLNAALLYSCTGLFGGINASEGIGTTLPFELVGLPNIDPYDFAREMNSLSLPGVFFRPISFMPKFGKFSGQTCAGAQIHITNRQTFNAAQTGFQIIKVLEKLSSANEFWLNRNTTSRKIDILLGENSIYSNTETNSEVFARWDKELVTFRKIASKYFLYQ